MTIRLITRGLPLLLLAAALWNPSPAEAKGLALITSGKTIKHLADLSEEAKKGKNVTKAMSAKEAIDYLNGLK